MIYKNSKDDHVLLRRGIKAEEIFDIGFASVVMGWLISIIVPGDNNYLLSFYIIAISIVTYNFGKRKKLPVGRLFDNFSIAFLTALPLWFVLVGLFAKNQEIIGHILIAVVLLTINIIFLKIFYPKILNRSIPDGRLSLYYIIVFSLIYNIYNFSSWYFYKSSLHAVEISTSFIFLITGVFLYLKRRN